MNTYKLITILLSTVFVFCIMSSQAAQMFQSEYVIETTDPESGDDVLDGFSVGSIWINESDNTVWRCMDASESSAVWVDITGGDVSQVGDGLSGKVFTADGEGNVLYFEGSVADSNETILKGGNVDSDLTLTLPSSSGSSDQVLSTDGSGALSWVDAGVISTLSLDAGDLTIGLEKGNTQTVDLSPLEHQLTLDLNNDDSFESTNLQELAVQGDAGNIASSPAENKLLFDFSEITLRSANDISTADWVLDEDDFTSNSDTSVATQQSINNYVQSYVSDWTLNEDDFTSNSDTKAATQQSIENRIHTLISASVNPNTTGFIEEIATTGDQGRYSSIALDSDGHPHIAYKDVSNNKLKYAEWTGSSWITGTVYSGDVEYISLTIDVADTAHIAYHENFEDDLEYATGSLDAGFSVSEWDTDGSTGEYTDIILDSDGNTHISYYDSSDDAIRYASGSSSIQLVESVSSGYRTSINIDSSGDIEIAYGGHYAVYDVDENDWNVSVPLSNSRSNVLLLDDNDNPHIVYMDSSSEDLRYASDTGSGWNSELVDSNGSIGYHLDAAMDDDNNIYVSYQEINNNNLRRAQKNSGTWTTYTVDTAGNTGKYSSTSVSSDGSMSISYYNVTEGDLRYAGSGKWVNTMGSYVMETGDTMRGQLVFNNDADQSPTQWPLRSAAPTDPSTGDVYADDGTNTDSGNAGLRIYDGAAWHDMGGGDATSGGVGAEDSGSLVVDDSTAFNFSSNLSVSDDGDGTVSVSATTGGSDVAVDLGNDGSNEVSVLENLATQNDGTGVVTSPASNKILFDFSSLVTEVDHDTLYGLIRYQSSAPTASDEVVYVDSDTNELKIYDAGTSSWITIAGGTSSGTATYEFSFTCPEDPEGDNVSIELEIDNNQDFSSLEVSSVSHSDETGWKLFDGSAWTDFADISGTGVVPSGYQGNRVTYTFTNSEVEEGTVYYVRFRVSDDGGGSWSDWSGETVSW